jgi:hypothetical protein
MRKRNIKKKNSYLLEVFSQSLLFSFGFINKLKHKSKQKSRKKEEKVLKIEMIRSIKQAQKNLIVFF